MPEKKVTIEITIPVKFEYDSGESATFNNPGALSEVCDIDFDIAEAEAAIWGVLESPEVLEELTEQAKAEIGESEIDSKIAAAGY